MANSNIGIERWIELNGNNYSTEDYSTGVSRWEELNQTKYTGDIINRRSAHNIFTLSTLPLGASQDDIYRAKYKGKSFNELNVLLRDMDEGTEKDWLTQYANSPEVMTSKDYENALSIVQNQFDWYQENNERIVIGQNARGMDLWDDKYREEMEALEEEMERLRAGHWQRGNMDKYGNLSANADYARLSGSVADERTSGKWNIGGDKVYDYINDIDGYREYIATGGRNMNASGGAARFLKYDNMTAEEISDYNYIYQKEGKEAAEEYLDWLSYQLDARQRGVERARAAELATEHPGIASIASIPANLASGAGLVDVALQHAGRALTGEYKPINYNRAAMGANTFSTGVRETVAQNIVDSTGVISIDSEAHPIMAKVLNGKSWADVYNLGMSMADSATIAAMSPVLGKAGTWLLGGAAGTQGMLDALERGGTDEQALFMGMLNGTFEALFERLSLDNLLSGSGRNLITTMLKQGLIEGSEELNTSFANNVADILIMAENSNYEKNIAAYIESGLDPEEARKQALWDAAIEMGWDFIGGVASGGIMGGGSYTVGSINARNEQLVNTYGEHTQELAQQGLELKPGNRFAQRMLDRAEAGKDLSAGQIGRLVRQNEKAINANDVTLIRQAAENRLKELGETGDVSELAKVLTKRAQGKALSRAERNLLNESRYGNRVANELNAANIESGEFSTGWAENIGTERINARQYNKGAEESSGQQSAITEEQQEKPTVAPQKIKTVVQQTEADNRQEAAKAPEELSNDRSEQFASQPASDNSLYTREPEISAEEAEDIEEQEGTVHDADTAYKLVQDMGRTGADMLEYAKGGVASRYLTEEQIEAAYSAGQRASDTDARTKDEKNRAKATGGTGRVEGTVRGDGVTIGDIDSFASEKFNSPQKRGYRILSAYAKATGINIVLYNSASPNATDEQKANTGKFDPKDSTMYIDINSGFALGESLDNMGKFALVRTFGHEFVHFIEKYNAAEYNELRRFVFDTLKERGENVAELIEEKRLAFNGEMSYDAASREVVAEALTDILPDSSLMQNMAEQHKGVFQSLVDKLKEFVADIKAYFAGLATPPSREARALQDEIDGSIRYLEELVKKYDEIAAKAVENYQATVATAEVETVAETVATAETEDTTAEKAAQDTLEENESKPKTSTSKNGYTVTDNPEYNSVDVKFPGKPSEIIRNALKANGFRWNGKRGVWYGKMSHEDAMAIIDKAYEEEMWAPPEVPTQTEDIEPAAEAEADNRQEIAEAPEEPANDEESTEKVEDIPPKAVTEEAKQEPEKAVRMPIKGSKSKAQAETKAVAEKQAKEPEEKTTAKKPAKSKELVTDETVKLDDFGEKIGGARKDLWSSRGLEVSDLEDMNDRERDKHVKKDNVWKRPDYVKLAEGGADKGLLYMQNEIRKSLPQNITYRRNETEESRRERQELFIQTVRQIEVLAKNVKTAAELEKIGYAWGLENGYLEKTGSTYQPYKLTNKYYSNPALSGSSYFQTVANLAKKFRNLKTIAENEGFAADAKSKLPKGYSIVEDNKGAWFIAKGSFIIKGDIASYDEALSMLKGALESKKRKTRFVPQQLLAVHRRGPNYRHGDNVEGTDYIDAFGFKGGEFGNWMSAKDRQVSLNYGFDALKDLAFALGIADTDISFGGKLSIAFGARGQGLSGASAHYEQDRQVINLTKMNGAGSLAHEWFHGLDDFMGGFKLKMGSDNVRSLPEKTQQAMRNLISTMQYRDETKEETDLRATKLFEQAQKNLKRAVENQFPWVKTLRAGDTEQVELLFPYYKRTPDSSDLAKFEAELSALIETGEMKHASNLSALRKEIQGHVISKEGMNNIGFYAIGVKNAGEGVQRGRVRTDFYNDSRRFGELHSKDGDYWDSTVEMAARAFACYVADKTGKNNDYLTGHAEAAFTLDADAKGNVRVIRAYPVGAERAAINKAFDELIAAMKEDGYLHDRVQEPTPEEVQYQAREYLSNEAEAFRSDIDAWDKGGRPDGETFILGSTGNVFQGLGAIESDVYMLSDKVNTIFKDHPEMTVKEIKNLPEILENPVLVLASRNLGRGTRKNTRLTVFGMVKAQNKLPVMVALDLHPVENNLYIADMQKVVSAYTKDGSPTAAMNLIENSDILYADKEKTTSLLHTVGFQNAYRMEQSGYIGNISYGHNNVNVSGVKFSDIFTEEADQYQFRVKSLTDREVLQLASKELKEQDLNMSEAERDALRIISDRLTKLQELETERREAGQLYRQQQFGPGVDREAAKATLERMHNLDRKIEQAESAVFRAENAGTVKRIVKRARKIAEDKDRAEIWEAIKRMNDRRDNAAAIKKYRNRIKADVAAMSEWVIHPNNKNVIKHVPDVLKSTVIPFITSIDMTSKRQIDGGKATKADEVFVKRLEAVQKKLGNAGTVEGRYSEYGDLPPDFAERLNSFVDKVKAITENTGSFQINKMDSAELKELSEIVRNLKKAITEVNVYHANAVYQHVYEGGDNSIEYMSGMKNAGMTNGATNFVMWQNMRPAYAFERFGKGGEAIYDGLRRGQAQLAFNTKKIVEFAEKAYTKKEVNDWAKEVKTFTIDGEQVKIPVSYIMGLYELSKRPQALTHILGDGIRIATFKSGASKISDTGHVISQKELQTIISSLTPRQKKVADALQKYMAEQGGKWGNHVSVKRWGEEMFGEEHYYPINSDGRHLSANADEKPGAASLYALLNMSFTKELQEGADNRIIVYDIFDVFSNHMASMAQYNALALPVLDAVKWFNYKQKNEAGKVIGSVREQMDRVYGVPVESKPGKGKQGYAQGFVENVIRAFNGTEAQGVPTDEAGLKIRQNYHIAQLAVNFRVIVQQPLAITRAALLVDYDSIIKGVKPQQAKQNIEEMRKYSGIAAWKALGFYDVNISRGVTDLIKHDTNWRDKANDIGMWGAEVADTLTWAGIWSACKEQVKKTKHLKPADKGFYEAVSELFEDVIYKTQVVDSVLTKSEYLRSKGYFAKTVGAFMSEPTTTASMLLSAFDTYHRDMQRGMSRQQAWKKNSKYILRVTYVYLVGQTLLAAVQSVLDAWRDDDEYQRFWEKWLEAMKENFWQEINPFNKLPYASQFFDALKTVLDKGFGAEGIFGTMSNLPYVEMIEKLSQGISILKDIKSGKDTNYTLYGGIYKLLQGVSGMSGLPLASVSRALVTFWNNAVGWFVPNRKVVRTYEPSETAQIKYAYQDGYLTAEEATAELLEKGIAQDENDAYWYIQEWESKDSRYSRYADIYDAVRNGGDFAGAMQELTSHGYTEKQVKSQIKSQIGTWYRDGEISKQQAISMLSKYVGMSAEEITKDVNKWSAKVVTGIAYDDIKDEYLAGNITAVRAAEMYVLYGGMSKEKAKAVIEVYDWQRQGYDYATEASIRDYKEFCQSANVPKDVYLAVREYANNTENDKDEDGKTISYSAMKKIMAKIDSYNLTAEQKTAIAKSLGWSDKNIDKYKLW